jgi:hypothetical protein
MGELLNAINSVKSFDVGAKVLIIAPMFNGSRGVVVGHNYDLGELVNYVEFYDKDDGVKKHIFFKNSDLRHSKI